MQFKTKWVSLITLGVFSIAAVGCQGQYLNNATSQPTARSQVSPTEDSSLSGVITQVANNLGINQATVSQLVQKQKVNADDLAVGSVVSEVTKQPLSDVLQTANQTGDWDAVVDNNQANLQQVKQTLRKRFPRLAKLYFVNHHPRLVIAAVSSYLGLSKQEIITDWRKYPVRPVGLVHAAILSKLSGKPLTFVLSMRMGNQNWLEVGKQLNVSGEQVKAEWKRIKSEWNGKMGKKQGTNQS